MKQSSKKLTVSSKDQVDPNLECWSFCEKKIKIFLKVDAVNINLMYLIISIIKNI